MTVMKCSGCAYTIPAIISAWDTKKSTALPGQFLSCTLDSIMGKRFSERSLQMILAGKAAFGKVEEVWGHDANVSVNA